MTPVLALALGVYIGRNWSKIKKEVKPLLEGLEGRYSDLSLASLGILARQKEKFDDMIAERVSKPKKRRKARRKR